MVNSSTVDEKHMQKHRRMKRKLIEFISKQEEAQAALDKANRRIQELEKQNSYLKQLQGGSSKMKMEEDAESSSDDTNKQERSKPSTRAKRRACNVTVDNIPRDEQGMVILPLELGPLTLISMGRIESEKPAYHCARHIYPVGYTVERTYMSMVNEHDQTTYTCKVEEGDNDEPSFVVEPKDDPENIIRAKTATGCWTVVAKKANQIRKKSGRNSISGPEYYGLAHPVIRFLIEEMGVDKCTKYKKSLQ